MTTFGLTEDEKTKLAERVRDAANGTSTENVRAILTSIANAEERHDVALQAVSLGGAADKIVPVLADLNAAPAGMTTKTKVLIGAAIVAAALGVVGTVIIVKRRQRGASFA